MDANSDTDVLLAMLSSLLCTPISDQSVLLNALVECNGDVEQAAQILNSGPSQSNRRSTSPPKQKRKHVMGLEGWVQRSPGKDGASYRSKSVKRARRESPTETVVEDTDDALSFHGSTSSKPRSSSSKPSSRVQLPVASGSSPSKAKPLSKQEFMSVLRPPNSTDGKAKASPPKHPPLTLSTPELVAKHTPCTIHSSILPTELACRNRWYLFDRLVESPHKTCFFVRQQTLDSPEWAGEMEEATRFWYNGAAEKSTPVFPPAMEEACKYVERIVNEEMHKRTRFPLEWGGEPPKSSDEDFAPTDGKKIIWRANVAASNCYEGAKETVGFHTDALTHLGPYPTIASLSLGTSRIFRLREVVPSDENETRSARTFNIPMPHNSLTIMHASCQETFKHSVPPQRTIDLFHPPFPPPLSLKNSGQSRDCNDEEGKQNQPGSNARINITFRFFRPDFRPSTTPQCKCGVACVLRPDMKNRYTYDGSSTSKGSSEPTGSGKPDSTRRNVVSKYWWTCHAGAQNEGKGCGMWKVMDAKAEGRGPFAGDV
ncbi:unnamed protein product [Somion occarium]|uniref:Fe2OG dioxygenase domain-containing protein n=1 Tax=Somion occarium TaxID=3059160 RepID=A0ABP1DD89_9APHY